jgi:hypothetical protein
MKLQNATGGLDPNRGPGMGLTQNAINAHSWVHGLGAMRMNSARLSLWRRIVLLAGVVVVVTGVCLLGYRYYTRPVTLTIAVGSIDGEAAKAMSAIAGRLASAPRLKPPRHLRQEKWIWLWFAVMLATCRKRGPLSWSLIWPR